jgi:hypothetical protein
LVSLTGETVRPYPYTLPSLWRAALPPVAGRERRDTRVRVVDPT